MNQYASHTLHSGRIVNIRPMTWEEYWTLGNQRLDLQGLIPTDDDLMTTQRKEFLQKTRELRQKPLEWCVETWDAINSSISVAEVLEIENIITAMSELPVQLGNSSPADATTATATKLGIAQPA